MVFFGFHSVFFTVWVRAKIVWYGTLFFFPYQPVRSSCVKKQLFLLQYKVIRIGQSYKLSKKLPKGFSSRKHHYPLEISRIAFFLTLSSKVETRWLFVCLYVHTLDLVNIPRKPWNWYVLFVFAVEFFVLKML